MSFRSCLGFGLSEGAMAPEFSLKGTDNKFYSLSDFKEKKVILYFYPQAFTAGCTAQACSFRNEYVRLSALGYVLLGVSTDAVSALQAFKESHGLPFLLLSDSEYKVAKAYGVFLPLLKKANRVTFLINEKRIIEKTFHFVPWKNYGRTILEAASRV